MTTESKEAKFEKAKAQYCKARVLYKQCLQDKESEIENTLESLEKEEVERGALSQSDIDVYDQNTKLLDEISNELLLVSMTIAFDAQ